MATDLYIVMGVGADASPEQITAAYDHWTQAANPDPDAAATPGLKELQDAYAILGHPQRRQAYGRRRAEEQLAAGAGPSRAEPLHAEPPALSGAPAGNAQPIEVVLRQPTGECHPSFDELFDRLWSNFSLLTRPKAEHLESLTVEIPLTHEEAMTGGHARILIPARAQCPACLGHGALGLYQCWRCQGHGAITADYPVAVAYPPGVLNEYQVRVPLSRFGIENFYLTVRFRLAGSLD